MTTTHEYRGYVFTIAYQPQAPAYTVDLPDVPDIITSGATLPEAFRHACEALDLHLERRSTHTNARTEAPSRGGCRAGVCLYGWESRIAVCTKIYRFLHATVGSKLLQSERRRRISTLTI